MLFLNYVLFVSNEIIIEKKYLIHCKKDERKWDMTVINENIIILNEKV